MTVSPSLSILVCKIECDLGRVSKLPRGAGVGVSIVRELDTLPRSRSILQTKMAAAPSNRSRESHGKIGGLSTVYFYLFYQSDTKNSFLKYICSTHLLLVTICHRAVYAFIEHEMEFLKKLSLKVKHTKTFLVYVMLTGTKVFSKQHVRQHQLYLTLRQADTCLLPADQ